MPETSLRLKSPIVVIKIGAIGDVCMALPALKRLDSARLTVIVGLTSAPLIQSYLPQARCLPLNERALFGSKKADRFRELLKIWVKLFSLPRSKVYVLQYDWRYLLLSLPLLLKGSQCVRLNRTGRNWLIPGRNHRFEYARILGIFPDDKMDFVTEITPVGTGDLACSKKTGRTIALCPGGARNNFRDDQLRRWPLSNYVKVAAELIDRGNQVVLIGATSDADCVSAFEGLDIRNQIGKFNLLECIDYLSTVDILVTHDSGPLHLAELAGCAVVAIFGPTEPQEKIPLGVPTRVLWLGATLSCCPCYDGNNYAECRHQKCMRDLFPEKVIQEICELQKTLVG